MEVGKRSIRQIILNQWLRRKALNNENAKVPFICAGIRLFLRPQLSLKSKCHWIASRLFSLPLTVPLNQNYKFLKNVSPPLDIYSWIRPWFEVSALPLLFLNLVFRYSTPYFTQSTEIVHNTSHLVVCVHGLDGNSGMLYRIHCTKLNALRQ